MGASAVVRRAAALIGLSLAFALRLAGDAPAQSPPHVMAPLNVVSSVLNIPVQTVFAQEGFTEPRVSAMFVGKVKPGSIAQRAGLRTGMEILSIQGTKVQGLTRGELGDVLTQEVADYVTLEIRRSWFRRPLQIRIPAPE